MYARYAMKKGLNNIWNKSLNASQDERGERKAKKRKETGLID
jgi:hypothetical protein